MSTTISPGTWVCVQLREHCESAPRPHRADEDGSRGEVTGTEHPGDHPLFVLFKGQHRPSRFPPDPPRLGGLGIGRYYRLDEVEVIPEPV